MRVVRATGQNVSPSDDGKLFNKIFSDGLFEQITITSLGSNLVHIPAMYGIIMGREFVTEAMDLSVQLPSSSGTGYIYVKYDLATTNIISIESVVGSFTPRKEDINGTGTVYEMIIATYTASSVAVTGITMSYSLAESAQNGTSRFTVSASSWSGSTTTVDGREYYTQSISFTKAADDHPSIMIGTISTLPTEAQQEAYNLVNYVTIDTARKQLKLYATEKPVTTFYIMVKGVM